MLRYKNICAEASFTFGPLHFALFWHRFLLRNSLVLAADTSLKTNVKWELQII